MTKGWSRKDLFSIEEAGKDARIAICSHGQSIPLFLAILKSGTTSTKINVASIGVLYHEEEL